MSEYNHNKERIEELTNEIRSLRRLKRIYVFCDKMRKQGHLVYYQKFDPSRGEEFQHEELCSNLVYESRTPELYQEILTFAKDNNLKASGLMEDKWKVRGD